MFQFHYFPPDMHSSKYQDVGQEVDISIPSSHFLTIKSLIKLQKLYLHQTYNSLFIHNRPSHDHNPGSCQYLYEI